MATIGLIRENASVVA